MPPSPIIKAELNEDALARLCTELNLIRPLLEIKLVPGAQVKGRKVAGYHQAGIGGQHLIKVTYDLGQSFEMSALRHTSNELCKTLLHEVRHAWQHEWAPEMISASRGLPYHEQPIERDATKFENRLSDYRTIIVVRRKFPRGPLSKLDATRRNVLRSV